MKKRPSNRKKGARHLLLFWGGSGMILRMNDVCIPMKWVGPVKITGPVVNDEVRLPLATLEAPLWPSVNRGARVSRECDGIAVSILDDRMTRSILIEALSAENAVRISKNILSRQTAIAHEITSTSRFCKLLDLHLQVVGNLIYLRIECETGDAAGHNMVTKAADAVMDFVLREYSELKYVSISGNFCCDKKVSSVNGILGRGKYVIAEIIVPREICEKTLKTTPEKIVDLHIKKNLVGTILAGAVRTANAHAANMLLAFYLATGQDAANIVEGSQCIVHSEIRENDLYFSVTLPNIIVGTVGSGKSLSFAKENLQQLGCLEKRSTGENARRLAAMIGAAVLCGELSLLAAQTNPGELMRGHLILERKK